MRCNIEIYVGTITFWLKPLEYATPFIITPVHSGNDKMQFVTHLGLQNAHKLLLNR